MNILIIIELFILGNVLSYGLNNRLNLTQLIKKTFVPELYQHSLRDIPVIRDISYLPEEIYDVENATKQKKLQQTRDNGDLIEILDYRNLCETVRRKVEINDSLYEYLPSHYYEVLCKSHSSLITDDEEIKPSQQKCDSGFHCVQRSEVLFLVRRLWQSEINCWEPYTMEIINGCECMWPVTTLDEITHHY